MKTTLFFLLLLCTLSVFAQTNPLSPVRHDAGAAHRAPNGRTLVDAAQLRALQHRGINPNARTVQSIVLDYDAVDELDAANVGGTYQRFIWDLNTRYDENDTNRFALTWAVVRFDT